MIESSIYLLWKSTYFEIGVGVKCGQISRVHSKLRIGSSPECF